MLAPHVTRFPSVRFLLEGGTRMVISRVSKKLLTIYCIGWGGDGSREGSMELRKNPRADMQPEDCLVL